MGDQGKHSRRTKSRPGFALIDADVLNSTAWKKLNGGAKGLYVFLRSKTFGQLNNAAKSPFKISYEVMISGTGLSRQTVRDSLIKLENAGFLDFTQRGGLRSGGLSCNEYKVSQRFLKYDSPLFQAGAEKKHPYKGRGFAAKAQRVSIVSIPAQSKNYTSNTKIN
jgi:hypothetical protein